MKAKISSKSDSIQVVYTNYLENKFIVNRRYQRKLVWTQEEKMAFIDSVYKQYSVPLFLLAEKEDGYEIIDGMQRLNAVVSFIENEFGIRYQGKLCYFDLEALASSKDRKDRGIINQKTPKLPRQVCIEIANYQMPFTYITAEENDVEEIFRRINSFGRQLSKQEIRQAGALGAFPDIVRKMSSMIRGDVTASDSVNLSNMKEISLSNCNLGYGIDLNCVFWSSENIITVRNMRISRDEEVIAWILAYMIMDKSAAPTSKFLDQVYKHDLDKEATVMAVKMENRIQQIGKQQIEQWFRMTFSVLLDILIFAKNNTKKDFRSLLYSDNEAEGLVRTFQVVFLALYELAVRENLIISDYNGLLKALDGLGRAQFSGITKKNSWNTESRYRLIQSVKGVMRPYFKIGEGEDVAKENWALELENIMRLSKVENGNYDFKCGFRSLSNGQFNSTLVSKCVKTLTAMVNKGPRTNGYVIVGVTEGKDSLKDFQNIYHSSKYRKYSNTEFYVTGIDSEVQKYYKNSTDNFLRDIISVIQKEPIDAATKQYILTHMKVPVYYDYSILVLHLKSGDTPVPYDDTYYLRNGSNNDVVKGVSAINALQDRFKKK